MLHRPRSRREAACFRGTRLSLWWDEGAEADWPAGFYPATVVRVPQEAVEGDEHGIYLCLEFEDQQKGFQEAWHDIEWAEFSNPAECKLTWLPLKAREHELKLREQALLKGKQLAGEVEGPDPYNNLLLGLPNEKESPKRCHRRLSKGPRNEKANPNGKGMATSSPAGKLSSLAVASSGQQEPVANGSHALSRKRAWDFEEGPSRQENVASVADEDCEMAVDSGDEANEQMAEPKPRPRARAPRKKRAARQDDENSNSGEGHEDASQREASQPAKKRQRVQPGLCDTGAFSPVPSGGGRGFAGQIKALKLENFMCHEHIAMEFNNRVNFICGQNGSGKTAVLHGLQTCLGVTAKQSGRASSGIEFLRDGANYSRATITLWNTGGDAYMPSRLGGEVTIVRDMRRSQERSVVSMWSILDAKGKKVASRRTDVDELLKSMNVSAANPMVCLTQDTARSFGGNKASQERYRVFMEATQFDAIIERLQLAENELEEMKARRKDVQKAVKERAGLLKVVLEKLDNMEEMRVWEKQQGQLQNWIAWEHVLEPRRKAEECTAKLRGQWQEAMGSFQQQRQEAEANLERAREEHAAQASAIQDFPERMSALQEEHHARNNLFQQAKRETTRRKREADRVGRALKEKQEEEGILEASIEETRTQMQEANEDQEQATALALRGKIAEAQTADAEVSAAKQAIREAAAVVQQASVATKDADQRRSQSSNRVTEVATALSRMRSQQSGNSVSAFASRGQESKLTQLVAGIEAALQRFHKKPLGPIGSLLTLTDDRWAIAVEASIGKIFGNFIVHDQHDANLIREQARRINMPVPSLVIYSYGTPAYDLAHSRHQQVPPHLVTALRVLRVRQMDHSHVVTNVLIDNCSAERVLLVENEADGIAAIRGPLSRANVITSAWDRRGWHGVRKGKNETSFPARQRLIARLRKDVQGATAELEEELRQLEQAHQTVHQSFLAAKDQERKAKEEHTAARNAAARKMDMKLNLDSQISELRSQHETQTQHHDASVEDLNLQLAELQRASIALTSELHEKKQAWKDAKDKEDAENEQLKAKRTELDEQLAANERELEAQDRCMERVQEAEAAVKQKELTIANLEEMKQKLESRRAEFIACSERVREKATEQCTEEEFQASKADLEPTFLKQRETMVSRSHADPPSDLDVMARWLSELERKIEVREQQVGSTRGELEIEKATHERWLKKRQSELTTLEQAVMLMMTSYSDRRARARKLRKDTLHAIETSFNSNLHQRGYTGGLDMSWDNHTLDFKVRPDPDQAEAVTDVKSLSGGERSFTNMCFIMAVGQDISSPFHCLDEFDVFMDAFNRRKSIEMLIRFGAVHDHLQLILLTPQDTHMIEDARQALVKSLGSAFPQGDFLSARTMGAPRQ